MPKLPVIWRTIPGPTSERTERISASCCCLRTLQPNFGPFAAVHLVFSASEVLAGAEVTDWPLR